MAISDTSHSLNLVFESRAQKSVKSYVGKCAPSVWTENIQYLQNNSPYAKNCLSRWYLLFMQAKDMATLCRILVCKNMAWNCVTRTFKQNTTLCMNSKDDCHAQLISDIVYCIYRTAHNASNNPMIVKPLGQFNHILYLPLRWCNPGYWLLRKRYGRNIWIMIFMIGLNK